ncbi:hypothetical protein BDV30DRAFT_218701 [Aspergillus minisclerotigenes]|uniref:Uncharacterized protein n=1 Tax=Aspergillus minisclerotigenes TaxID=656917 RepID=A0A5N6IQT7_9EURO|nr:hypothetical protein BDV30DRAFT_218701 [Aspergillus minisclerotigenes]
MIIMNYYYPPTNAQTEVTPIPLITITLNQPFQNHQPLLRLLVIPRLQSIAEEKVRPSAVGLDDGSFLG